ncbi:hypothetical protein C5L25_000455 [Secundilactobacillus silagei JCM 19001]|uniref:Uncharacterized protein n=1 Tax=Secundilactobacillus silagei JCM 19001 TaxID=1302250 RepID=A0A1Z5IFY1_9LACO|nr:hypothetical protein C5L25_000455 [Secundilactobacillus silagei JCM 19001]GAX00677.1 hypothetical protein IWT126_00692 [Secundilactobacillus silagei JCM 19001]
MEVGITDSNDSDIQIKITHITVSFSVNEVQFLIEPTELGRVTHK